MKRILVILLLVLASCSKEDRNCEPHYRAYAVNNVGKVMDSVLVCEYETAINLYCPVWSEKGWGCWVEFIE